LECRRDSSNLTRPWLISDTLIDQKERMTLKSTAHPAMDPSWAHHLNSEFEKEYMQQLRQFLKAEYSQKKIIYPQKNEYFAAFNLTPLDQVKVVILGQDPYHGPGQAHGFCFSVRKDVRTPPSLVNIFKEIRSDLGIENGRSGDLRTWAQQGVLLLNSVLTVEGGKAGSHSGKGWESFTDKVIEVVNKSAQPCVFLLWGSHAQKKAAHVNTQKHLVLRSPHPSPLSAHRGFLGCRHFSKANKFLIDNQREPIDWELPLASEDSHESTI